ncbi:unnamed protein product, partial [Closterium sp. NIES-54]
VSHPSLPCVHAQLAVHESAGVRAVAVDAIDRAVMAALSSPSLHRRSSTSSSSALTTATPASQATEEQQGAEVCRKEGQEGVEERERDKGEGEGEGQGEVALEEMVVGAVSSLWRDGRDAEVKAGALRILLHMLEAIAWLLRCKGVQLRRALLLFLSTLPSPHPTSLPTNLFLSIADAFLYPPSHLVICTAPPITACLQRHGEKLHSTWPTVLHLLR